jgi:hypothetical protein
MPVSTLWGAINFVHVTFERHLFPTIQTCAGCFFSLRYPTAFLRAVYGNIRVVALNKTLPAYFTYTGFTCFGEPFAPTLWRAIYPFGVRRGNIFYAARLTNMRFTASFVGKICACLRAIFDSVRGQMRPTYHANLLLSFALTLFTPRGKPVFMAFMGMEVAKSSVECLQTFSAPLHLYCLDREVKKAQLGIVIWGIMWYILHAESFREKVVGHVIGCFQQRGDINILPLHYTINRLWKPVYGVFYCQK